ncbi:alkane hydroxylase MAH1-like [Andrographis paniculata]|uniref:alkane hydroxylase MAH1-like n=1 Tax=Andrographis paniculata TaxID=175694 RepID=UPI0021E7443E|nr:alkane hydroxylase MAH1-like [Andrographis paniculata]
MELGENMFVVCAAILFICGVLIRWILMKMKMMMVESLLVFPIPNIININIPPLMKMLPTLYLKSHQLYTKITQVLEENRGTVLFKTSWFTSHDILITSDPINVRHVMNSKFTIYQRGSEFKKAFDFLGEAVFIKDYDQWREEKRFTHGFFKEARFHDSIPKTLQKTLEKALIPVLDHHSHHHQELELQDFFNRFMLDATCLMATGFDLGALRVGLPPCSLLKAMDDMAEAVFCRHILPERVWKLQRWLGIGKERKMSKACKNLNQILANFVSKKYEEIDSNKSTRESNQGFDVLNFYISSATKGSSSPEKAYLAANIMTILFAGRDTSAALLTWFFHLISTHPRVETTIIEEIKKITSPGTTSHIFSNIEELNKLVYLHATLYETLRLFPTAPVIIRDPVNEDVLPTGHRIGKGTKVILCSYAMGRRRDIWGDDCKEFKPERWMSRDENGGTKHVASSSFLAFGSGPWACPGKDLGFARMKGVVATMLHNFKIRVLEGQTISPSVSALLSMRHGLKVRVRSRWN